MREYARQRRATDPAFLEKCREATRKCNEKNKEQRQAITKLWREKNKEKIAEYNKKYAEKNKDIIKATRTIRNQEKKEQYGIVTKKWREQNAEHLRKWNAEYTIKRYKNDPIFALKLNQRTRTRHILKNNKNVKTHELLGCSFDELKLHLESQFKKGMNWKNMGEWHIDHIIPLAAFDLTKLENQLIAFNYKNLQPLWAKENLQKGAKYA